MTAAEASLPSVSHDSPTANMASSSSVPGDSNRWVLVPCNHPSATGVLKLVELPLPRSQGRPQPKAKQTARIEQNMDDQHRRRLRERSRALSRKSRTPLRKRAHQTCYCKACRSDFLDSLGRHRRGPVPRVFFRGQLLMRANRGMRADSTGGDGLSDEIRLVRGGGDPW